jgi:hypothetical protein
MLMLQTDLPAYHGLVLRFDCYIHVLTKEAGECSSFFFFACVCVTVSGVLDSRGSRQTWLGTLGRLPSFRCSSAASTCQGGRSVSEYAVRGTRILLAQTLFPSRGRVAYALGLCVFVPWLAGRPETGGLGFCYWRARACACIFCFSIKIFLRCSVWCQNRSDATIIPLFLKG